MRDIQFARRLQQTSIRLEGEKRFAIDGQPALFGGKGVSKDSLCHGLQASAERSLQDSKQKKEPQSARDPT
jgi:hypothetical protein